MAENVKVAVRVRPFNDREKNRKAKCIVKMSGNNTELYDPNNQSAEPKRFAFDKSYWSHDGFKVRGDGYLEADSSEYVDQDQVFRELGQVVLDNAWMGYNCCLFAYGQTGSGKSYSIVGYGANKGIVPVACEKLFAGIAEKQKIADTSKEQEYQVFVSMLEIYNEQVRDLLAPNSFKVKGGLKCRMHPSKGFYVESLKTFPVKSYADINNKITEGTRNRTIAATNMNATSSRAHTIVSINFLQKGKNDAGQNMTKSSTINLVDLAGSERVESTGATGDRLKEGALINLSLTSLGNVIKALADKGAGKKNVLVPYRDAKLTMLLKNALGGNSKTLMIAAISPADINYDETLSTLRYANRAKSIRTKAIVNESPTEKLIRELKEENARLMKELEGKGGGGSEPNEEVIQGIPEEQVEEMKRELEEQLRQNQMEMDVMKKTWEQRLKEVQSAQEEELQKERKKQEEMKVIPHFWNLNEDPSLTGMVIHFTKPGVVRVGNNKASPPPDILLTGLNVQPEHAVITSRNNTVAIKPCTGAKILINGKEITEKTELHHNDRVLFGSKHLYVFHHPKDLAKNKKEKSEPEVKPTYDSAQEEIVANSGFSVGKGPNKSQDEVLLQQDLVEMMPHVTEANAMSDELKKRIRFEIVLISPQARGLRHGRTEVCVVMKNISNENEFLWDRNKFLNRKYLMEEMYQNYQNGDKDWDVERDRDPFWEPPETEVLIGKVHIYLQSMGYLIEIEETLAITDYRGREQGLLQLDIIPCTSEGDCVPEEDFVDDPSELIGKPANFKFCIHNARGLPSRVETSFCKYQFYLDRKPRRTKVVRGTTNPDYNFEHIVPCKMVTKSLLDYFDKECLIIEIWGTQKGSSGDSKTKDGSKRNGVAADDTDLLNSSGFFGFDQDEKYQMTVALSTEKRRVVRLENKLSKLQRFVDDALRNGQMKIDTKDIDDILKNRGHPSRFRGAARVIAMTEKAKRNNNGKVTSAACSLQ